MKWIAVADHPYYPQVREFEDQGEAELWIEDTKEELADESGHHKSRFYVARVRQKKTAKTFY